MMFRIKICGVTNQDDARLAVQYGADAVGVNFWPRSPRYVGLDVARSIAAVVQDSAKLVGVFVDSPVDEVLTVADDVGLDLIQLHGNERGAFVQQLQRPVVQAVSGARTSVAAVYHYLDEVGSEDSFLCGFLVDSASKSLPGGTGELANWSAARALIERFPQIPIGLAGGLRPGNVAHAIQHVRPAAVDVASGVESAPGKKSERLMAEFIAAARAAF